MRAALLLLLALVAAILVSSSDADVSGVTVSVDSTVAGNLAATWTFTVTATSQLQGSSGDSVTIAFPTGIDPSGADGATLGGGFAGSCSLPPSLGSGQDVVVSLPAGCDLAAAAPGTVTMTGISPSAGTYPATGFLVSTSQESTPIAATGSDIVIGGGGGGGGGGGSTVSGVTFSGSSTVAGASSDWTVGFTSSGSGTLVGGIGNGYVLATFPAGFTIPASVTASFGTGFSGTCASIPGANVGAQTVEVDLPTGCSLGSSTAATLTLQGLTNPATANAYSGAAVATSSDAVPASASAITITSSTSQSITAVPVSTSLGWSATTTIGSSGSSGTGAVTASLDSGTNGHTSDGVCHLTGTTLSATGAGACWVYVTIAADGTYSSATSADVQVTFTPVGQAALTLTSTSGLFGSPLTLATSGGSGTGGVTYAAVDGTATGCSITAGALSVTHIGTCLVTATKAADADYNVVSSAQTTVTISAGPPSQLVFTTQPGGGTSLVAWATQPVVKVEDSGGNVVTSDAHDVTLTIHSGTGTLSGCTAAVAFSSGVAAFSGCAIDRGGSFTLTATDAGDSLTATSGTFTVAAAAATRILFTTQPSDVVIGSSVTVKAAVVDDLADVDTTDNTTAVTLALSANPSGTSLSCNSGTTVTVVAGVASFTCTLSRAGAGYAFTASSAGLTSGASSTFSVTAGTTVTLLFAASSIIQAGAPAHLRAQVVAASGAGSPGGAVTFYDGATVISGCSNIPISLSDGTAVCTATGLAAGTHAITAAYGGDANFQGSAPATVSLVVEPLPVPAAPTDVTAKQGKNNTTVLVSWTASPATGTTITYTVIDSKGNQVGKTTGTQVSVTYASSQLGKSLTFTVSPSDSAGTGPGATAELTVVESSTIVGTAQTAVGYATSSAVVSTKPLTVPAAAGSPAGSPVSVVGGVVGAGTITTQAYSGQPIPGAHFATTTGSGTQLATSYFDIQVTGSPKLISFQACGAGIGLDSLQWYDAKTSKYRAVTDQRVLFTSGNLNKLPCLKVNVYPNSTSPSLADMHGTVFALLQTKLVLHATVPAKLDLRRSHTLAVSVRATVAARLVVTLERKGKKVTAWTRRLTTKQSKLELVLPRSARKRGAYTLVLTATAARQRVTRTRHLTFSR